MAVIAFTSPRSPGTTTAALALALTWPRPSLLIEADPAGSSLHTGFLRSRGDLGRGLFNAALAARTSSDPGVLREQATALDASGNRQLITGITHPGQGAPLAELWPTLTRMLTSATGSLFPHDVLADCGRIGHRHRPAALLEAADAVVVLAAAEPGAVHAALASAALVRDRPGPAPLLLATIGADRQLPEAKITQLARAAGLLYLGALPTDQKTADMLSGRAAPGRGLERRPLMLAAQSLGQRIYTVIARTPRPAPAAPTERPAPPTVVVHRPEVSGGGYALR